MNQCSTCGETSEDKLIMQCTDCDGERYYYQLQRWRKAAIDGERALLSVARQNWWQKLLRRPPVPTTEEATDFLAAVDAALELEKEHADG